jgi:hypothetical protein
MKIDDFIKLLEQKKAEGFTDVVRYFMNKIGEDNYVEIAPHGEILRNTKAQSDDEFKPYDSQVCIDRNIKHLIGQKVLVI